MTDYSALRRYPRIDSAQALLVCCLGAQRQEGFVKTRVVGLGGCMFVHDRPLGVGTALEVAFAIQGRVGRGRGRIVYELAQRCGQVEVGVEFLYLAPADRQVLGRLFAPNEPC